MRLPEAISTIEQRWTCVDGLPVSVCQTGEPYEVISSHGVYRDTPSRLTVCGSEDAAIVQWFNHFMRYGLQKRGTLYWRSRPEITFEKGEKGSQVYKVYSRLIITSAPVRFDDMKAYDRWAKKQKAA